MSLAIIFNGQGAQYKEMGQDFARTFPEARAVYEKIETLTNYPVRQWITDDFEALQETRYAQVAIAATSLAIYESIQAKLPAIDYMAGLSLGEYSSRIASGMLSLHEGLSIIKPRAQVMTTHSQTTREYSEIVMGAVMTMQLEEIQAVLTVVNKAEEILYQ